MCMKCNTPTTPVPAPDTDGVYLLEPELLLVEDTTGEQKMLMVMAGYIENGVKYAVLAEAPDGEPKDTVGVVVLKVDPENEDNLLPCDSPEDAARIFQIVEAEMTKSLPQ